MIFLVSSKPTKDFKFFLKRPQNQALSIMSWNIIGLAMKAENGKVQELLLKFDVIGLNEIK